MVNLHRTYVRAGEKALGKHSKRLCRPVRTCGMRGSAVRLYEASEQLALTEGIESALAVRLGTGWPAWSCWSAVGLAAVAVPDTVRDVAIWVDHDSTGIKSAEALAERLTREGRAVQVIRPPAAGMDALDWLKAERGSAR